MKLFLVLSAYFIASSAFSYRDLYLEEWSLYKAEHRKSYLEEEESRRLEVFLDNKLFVAQHNARFRRGEETFDVEINKYSDWFPEELDQLNGFNRENRLQAKEGEEVPLPELNATMFVPPSGYVAPDSVDWVKAGAVTSVKDQQTCGSCYAFSAVGALEGQMYLKYKKKESLSVQNIVDCSRKQGNQGCRGGFASFSFQYVRSNNGINTEAVYPYESKEGTCRFKPNNIGATCNGYEQVEKNEKRLKEAVATVGPIAINMDCRHKSFIQYKSGVYSESQCHPYTLVHALLLVGYGVDPATKREYWVVKNSWGTKWGENGYVRVARNANNMCGIATLATYPKM